MRGAPPRGENRGFRWATGVPNTNHGHTVCGRRHRPPDSSLCRSRRLQPPHRRQHPQHTRQQQNYQNDDQKLCPKLSPNRGCDAFEARR
jgi:hypothetical protein